MIVHGFFSFFISCNEVFGNSVAIVSNHRVGNVENVGRRAIVLREDYVGVRLEIDEHIRASAAPFVDCLVRVADDEEVSALFGKNVDESPIGGVAVLHLVDLHVVERGLPIISYFFETLEEIERKVYNILKIEHIVLSLQIYIVDNGLEFNADVAQPGSVRNEKSRDVIVRRFKNVDALEKQANGIFCAVESVSLHSLFSEAFGVFFVDYSERFRVAYTIDVASKEFDAETVDCANEVVRHTGTDKARNAGSHLLCRLVSKSHTKYVGRINAYFVDDISKPMSQNARLAGAGTDTYTSFGSSHRFTLPII